MNEVLSFSLNQLVSCLDNPDNWNPDGLVVRKFYNGEEFNSRQPIGDVSTQRFLDSVIVYEGVVDESKVTSRTQSPDDLFDELFAETDVKKSSFNQ